MNTAFFVGFEKRAYDYGHEVRELDQHYEGRAGATPMDATEASRTGRRVGAIFGGLMGALLGATTHKPLMGAALGAGVGGLAGAGLGHMGGISAAMRDKLGIEEAKRIITMPKKERREYLLHLARQNEISESEAEEWSRTEYAENRADLRHGARGY